MVMTVSTRTRSYSKLMQFQTYEDRYEYLRLVGSVGVETFGPYRDLNQDFYASPEWQEVREYVILRDNACDLAMPGYDIYDYAVVHHINPMEPEHIMHGAASILDPNNLITVTRATHNAIHFGSELNRPTAFTERQPGDTATW